MSDRLAFPFATSASVAASVGWSLAKLPAALQYLFSRRRETAWFSGVVLLGSLSGVQAASLQLQLSNDTDLGQWLINGTPATTQSSVSVPDSSSAQLNLGSTANSEYYWLFYTNSNQAEGNLQVGIATDAALPVSQPRGMILIQGTGASDSVGGTVGPTIVADVAIAGSGFNFSGGQFQSAQEGSTSGVQVVSSGASNYGWDGGNVNVQLSSGMMLGGTLTPNGGSLPWRSAVVGVAARSVGNNGVFQSNCDDYTGYCDNTVSPGGNGGSVSLTSSGSDVHVQLGSDSNPLNTAAGSAAVGLLAISQGGMGATQGFHGTAGDNGAGGSVGVSLGAHKITGNASNVIGVVAASVGGATAPPSGAKVNVVPSGASNEVSLALQGTQIVLTGNNAIGVVATTTGDVIVPADSSLEGGGNSMGPVTVTLGSGSQIAVGDPGGVTPSATDTNIGILALSSPNWASAPFTGAPTSTMFSPGAPGAVSVELDANTSVSAFGSGAIGVLGQSLAGNGANASGGTQAFVGDRGGPGGTANSVSLVNAGSALTTQGDGAIGALLQSVAGGGGNGGNAAGLFVAVGGDGGNGGQGGTVSYSQSSKASITTQGDYAQGLVLQSVGGGGGNGGFAKAYSLVVPVAVGVGGQGGIAGNGGNIQLAGQNDSNSDTSGSIQTQGQHAHGIVAHTIGAGGGTGGAATTVAASVFTLGVAVGGNGAGAGSGGQIGGVDGAAATSAGTVTTTGHDAHGVLLQSIGGGGGAAGGSTAASLSAFVPPEVPTVNVDVAIGGRGGNGGDGGAVSFFAGSGVQTRGAAAHGITLQSIGGGGGLGGDATGGAGSFLQAASLTFNSSVGVGGSGGRGGVGGEVDLEVAAAVVTQGHHAVGVTAQSIGGGGGVGGVGNAASVIGAALEEASMQIEIGVGGSGGSAGTGGTSTVSVQSGGTITTTGSGAVGVLAQSLGGGGGVAGNAGAQAIGGKFSQGVTVGGAGGSGNDADAVSVTFAGQVSTGDKYQIRYQNTAGQLALSTPVAVGGGAHGIVAQSIGGGGGLGGNADPSATIVPDLAGAIIDDVDKLFDVKGSLLWWAKKIVDYDTEEYELPKAFKSKVAVGGSGGAAGDGGTVSVALSPGTRIATVGHRTYAVLAQSVGGGGGVGGSASGDSLLDTDVGLSPLTGFDFDVGVNVGGSDGASGHGGTINLTVNNAHNSTLDNRLVSSGYGSHLLMLQSVGAGGGVGHEGSMFGLSGKLSGYSVPAVTLGSLTTGSSGAGDGGGISLGTSQSSVIGLFETSGDDASVVMAQSIGGGGGLASVGCTNSGRPQGATIASACYTNAGTAASTTPDTSLIASAFVNRAQAFDLSIQGSSSGDGNEILMFLGDAGMHTTGDRATVIVAQSVGGGGGYASADLRNVASTQIQVNPSTTTSAADITLQLAKTEVTTAGHGSWGILAQSIANGGGLLGDTSADLLTVPAVEVASGSIGSGTAGDIQIHLTERSLIQTGDGSQGRYPVNTHGIVAQSLGGGGGIQAGAGQSDKAGLQLTALAGDNPGAAGSITIGVDPGSAINAQGIGAIGILAQRGGYVNTEGTIAVSISGSVTGGRTDTNPLSGNTLTGVGVMVSGAGQVGNTITINEGGVLSTQGGQSAGYAIRAGDGPTTVTNHGTMTGSVDLGDQPSSVDRAHRFTNFGVFKPGASVSLPGASLENHGVVQVGNGTATMQTQLVGDFHQSDTGQLVFATGSDAAGVAHSQLNVQGVANLAGTVAVQADALLPGALPVLQATQLNMTARVAQPLLYRWEAQVAGDSLSLTPLANFRPQGLSLDATGGSLAGYLQQGWHQADRGKARLFGYLSQVQLPQHYQDALRQLSGQSLLAQPQQLVQASYDTFNDALACPSEAQASVREGLGQCSWVRISGNRSDLSSTSSTLGYRSEGAGLRAGFQQALNSSWRVGGSVGVNQNRLTAEGFSSKGQAFQASASLTRHEGPLAVTGAVAVARGNFRNERTPQLGAAGQALGLDATHDSKSHTTLVGARVRTAYQFQAATHYIKPYLDVDVIHTRSPGFVESGGALALEVGGVNKTQVVVTPMLEVGAQRELKSGAVVRGYASGGASIMPNNQRTVSNRLATAQTPGGTFNLTREGPKAVGRFNLGVEVQAPRQQNVSFRAEYSAEAGGKYRSQSVSARLNIRF